MGNIVHNDIVFAIDHGQMTALMMLDLSSAFNHDEFLAVLNCQFAMFNVALDWFQSYLPSYMQAFHFAGAQSPNAHWNVQCHKEPC